MTRSARFIARNSFAASVAVLTVLTAACSSIAGSPVAKLFKPTLTANVGDRQTGVSPADPITAKAQNGKLTEVTLLNARNLPVAGQLAPDGHTWRSTVPLGYNQTYRLIEKGVSTGGEATRTVTFTTVEPNNVTMPYPIVADGEVVGIGQPVAIQFDENIADRWAAQQAVHITTSPPVAGAFYWISDRDLRWRPEHFWAPGTKITVDADVYGRNLGHGLYGQQDVHETYSVGDAVVFTADDNTHHVVVTRNGKVIRDMPTSMGKSSTPTPNGIYYVGNRSPSIVMDSSTFGVPVHSAGGYRVTVYWDTQLAYNGVYMHSAPWSVWAQGSSDTSHGCLNLSPENAEWVENMAHRGDVAIVMHTVGEQLSGTDGLGDWNIPWNVWKAGDAGPAPAGPPAAVASAQGGGR
jgi:lipoprotein-anchoring transpeptidase ErfK/SrfK